MRAALLLAALSFSGAAVAAPEESDRSRVEAILVQLDALSDVDLGYCDNEYPDFSVQYRALVASPPAEALFRAIGAFELESSPPDEVDHEPSEQRCFASMQKAKALFTRHGTYLQRLAARLPPAGG
ncbi:hypothetical protein [Dokdonella sp.]|uniref:hypothetical protein n=1 Tax=Dokdonella sp. TaxID=2291710 RepID=UPI002632A97F|nr:hypothetical protein [Dokdonella sp.]